MVYGRYNYSIHGLYKPTNITGGHHPADAMFAAHPMGSPWRREQVNGWAELMAYMAYMAYARHGVPRAAVS